MTILKHEKIQITRKGKLINRFRNRVIIQCDYCGQEKIFEKAPLDFIEKPFHYCSRKCFHHSMSGGVSDQLRKQKFKEKTGCEYPTQLESVKLLIKENNLFKYGVENISQLQNIKEQKTKTLLENYGVESPLQSKQILDKIKETNIKKYGGTNPMHDPLIVDKLKSSILDQYGADNVSKLIEIKNKKEETLLKNYGVINPMFSEEIKSKIDYSEIWKKAHKTKKENGTYKASKIEDKLYKELCDNYGVLNIERQSIVNGWSIDFYIKNIKTYLQLDGVYWHGLDRDFIRIKSSSNIRDKNILRKIEVDELQNEWFKIHNIKLIRISDQKYKNTSFDQIIKIIEGQEK